VAARKKGRGGARVGSGRKPKPPEAKQSHKIMATFTPAEHEALQRAAEGEPLGSVLRRLALRFLARRRK